jgi:hypothetical protein
VTEVSEDAYAYIQPNGTWFLSNAGFLVARDGVTSIDAGHRPAMPERGRAVARNAPL